MDTQRLHVAAIVQARLNSSRLPGKVLRTLGGRTVLEHVLRRCAAVPGVSTVCCATVEGPEGDDITAVAERAGAVVFRGDRDDVLDRYYRAAQYLNAAVVVRVTSDNPLIDPHICGQVLRLLTTRAADYSCNNMPRLWPYGLDCEAIRFGWLERAALVATHRFDREHVTPFIRSHPDARRMNLAGPGGGLVQMRWTLDHPEDYAFLKALFDRLPDGPEGWDYRVPAGILEQDPPLADINRHLGTRGHSRTGAL